MESKKSRVKHLVVPVLLAALVAWLCWNITWTNDDVYFKFYYGGEDLQQVTSWTDLAHSQWNYYLGHTGRLVTHCLVQAFCAFTGGQLWFTLCNTLAWLLLVVLIVRLGGYDWRRDTWVVAGTAAMALLSFRTQFSPPCQVNYIWAMVATLVIIGEFLRPQRRQWLVEIAVLLLALLAGCGQESLSSGVAGAMLLHAAWRWRKTTARQWAIAVLYTVGMLFMCLAPGNFSRMVSGWGGYWTTPVTLVMLLRMTYLLLAVIVVVVWQAHKAGTPLKAALWRICSDNAFWFSAMVLMLVFNFIVRISCNRQLFGIELMAIIVILRLVRTSLQASPRVGHLAVGVLLMAAMLVAVEDVTTVVRRNALCREIETLYRNSPDGVVYCDIPERDFGYQDQDAMYSYNGWTIAMQQRLWLAQGDKREFQWRPLAMRELVGKDLPSQVIDAGQGTYLLIANRRDSVCEFSASNLRNFYGFKVHGYELPIRTDRYNYGFEFSLQDKYYTACVLRDNGSSHPFIFAKLIATHVKP